MILYEEKERNGEKGYSLVVKNQDVHVNVFLFNQGVDHTPLEGDVVPAVLE